MDRIVSLFELLVILSPHLLQMAFWAAFVCLVLWACYKALQMDLANDELKRQERLVELRAREAALPPAPQAPEPGKGVGGDA